MSLTPWPQCLLVLSVLSLFLVLSACSSDTNYGVGRSIPSGEIPPVKEGSSSTGTWNQPPHGGIDEKSSNTPDKRLNGC